MSGRLFKLLARTNFGNFSPRVLDQTRLDLYGVPKLRCPRVLGCWRYAIESHVELRRFLLGLQSVSTCTR